MRQSGKKVRGIWVKGGGRRVEGVGRIEKEDVKRGEIKREGVGGWR